MFRLTLTQPRDERNARVVWCVFFVALSAYLLLGSRRSVTPHYHRAAQHWLQQAELYSHDGRGFLYLPQAAILYVPFSLMPYQAAEITWRLVSIALFAAGVFRLCKLAEQTGQVRLFPLVTCLTIPLTLSACRNGQSTMIISGLMMLAAWEISRERWTRASVLLCLALAFKPLTLVLMLLAAAIYRPLLKRLFVGTAMVLVAPYLLQNPAYVSEQYAGCWEMLGLAAQRGIDEPWAQLFGLLETFGLHVPELVQTPLRVGAAGLTLLAAWQAHRHLPAHRFAIYLYALAGSYLMLFNPRTENNSYALLAPSMAILGAELFLVERRYFLGAMQVLFMGGTLGSFEIGSRLIPWAEPIWLAPLMCVGFTGCLLAQLAREVRADAASLQPAGAIPVCLPHRFAG